MKVFKKIRQDLGKYLLTKKLKELVRDKQVMNLELAKTAGITFNASNKEAFELIKSFLNTLIKRKINVFAIGYVNEKKIPDQLILRDGFNFFCQEDLNWLFIPDNETIKEFIRKDFDILIDLDIENTFPINYIGSLSKARFKAGMVSSAKDYLDFMINIEKDYTVQFLIEQISHYLDLINIERTVEKEKVTD